MGWVVLWDTACNFNVIILNQSIFNCLITSASTLNMRSYNVPSIILNYSVFALEAIIAAQSPLHCHFCIT